MSVARASRPWTGVCRLTRGRCEMGCPFVLVLVLDSAVTSTCTRDNPFRNSL